MVFLITSSMIIKHNMSLRIVIRRSVSSSSDEICMICTRYWHFPTNGDLMKMIREIP
jgi:hypothetical protein